MGYSNGQLETSSGTGRGEKGEPGLPGIGFNLTDDGNFDLDSKRLTDVADSVHDQDAATKKYLDDHVSRNAASKAYVDTENSRQDIAINSKAEGDEVLVLDGSKVMKGNLDMDTYKIVHLGDGLSPGDAVNYSQLLSHTDNHRRDYRLAPSFKIYKDFGDNAQLTKSNAQIKDHRHLHLYDVGEIEGSDSGFRGEAWSSLKMTNTLERGIYTVIFKTFSFYGSLLNDETLLQSVHGDDHFKVLTFSHDWQSNSGGNTPHSKTYIQFSSDGQSGEIKFQIRYYGSSYNQVGLDLLLFSRVLRGKYNNTFGHQLFDVKESDYLNHLLFFEDLNLNDNKITNVKDPVHDGDVVNKKYFKTNAVLLNGNNLMKSNIDMSGRRIYNLPNPIGPNQPATKSFVENKINDYLKRDGSLNMTGNLKMDKNYTEDLETPNDVPITDLVNYRKDAYQAANKEYLRPNFLKRDENGGNDYDLKQKVIRNAAPYRDGLVDDDGLVSKAFVYAETAKLPKNVLKLDDSFPMKGNLQMGNNTIRNLKMPANNPSSGNPPDDCALNFKYFHSQRGDLERQINEVGSDAFSKDGSDPMGGNLDMNNHEIINLKEPQSSNSQYAATAY